MAEQEEQSAETWTGFSADFQVTGARIVATLGSDGGAIVENVRRLHCSEGRLYTFECTPKGDLHQLEYVFSFSSRQDGDPMAATGVSGRIVIAGRHTNGHRLEIRGHGWIGYDESGNIDGRFDSPPVIITEDCDPDTGEDHDEHQRDRPFGFPDFPMPPQFVQATVRVPDTSDWLDDD
jgi:hypothetical protein